MLRACDLTSSTRARQTPDLVIRSELDAGILQERHDLRSRADKAPPGRARRCNRGVFDRRHASVASTEPSLAFPIFRDKHGARHYPAHQSLSAPVDGRGHPVAGRGSSTRAFTPQTEHSKRCVAGQLALIVRAQQGQERSARIESSSTTNMQVDGSSSGSAMSLVSAAFGDGCVKSHGPCIPLAVTARMTEDWGMTQAGKTGAEPTMKYADELKKCPDQPCPKTGKFVPTARAGCFRFVHAAAANDDADFLPYPLTPLGKADGLQGTCEHWALSFFESREALLKKWAVLGDRLDAEQRYGTHAAEIDLLVVDGLMGAPSKKWGHISLHEFPDHPAFAARVKATTALPTMKKTLANAMPAPPTSGERVTAKKPGA